MTTTQRAINPHDTVTRALQRTRGVVTQKDLEQTRRALARIAAIGDVPQTTGENLDVVGDLTVRGNGSFLFDNAGDFVSIGPTYDPSDPLATGGATFRFVYAGSVGQDSYLQIADVAGYLIAKIPVGDYHEFWQAGAKFKRIDGAVMAQIDATTGNITTVGTLSATGNIAANGGAVIITRDGTQSLLVQKADATKSFVVNTTSLIASLRNGTDLLIYSDDAVTQVFGVDGGTGTFESAGTYGTAGTSILNVFGHFKHKSTAPSIAVGTALGTGGSVDATFDAPSTDQAGTINLTAGTTSLTTGVAATITFASARPNANYSVILSPADPDTGANLVKFYRGTRTTTTWEVKFQTAPSSGVVYVLDYWIVERIN
jgi:hypothetical protein